MTPPYKIALAIALTVSATPSYAAGEEYWTGNTMHDGCVAVINNDTSMPFSAGTCLGVAATTAHTLHQLKIACFPPQSTVVQDVRIMVKFMNSNPQYMHKDIRDIAVEALTAAFPCKAGAPETTSTR